MNNLFQEVIKTDATLEGLYITNLMTSGEQSFPEYVRKAINSYLMCEADKKLLNDFI